MRMVVVLFAESRELLPRDNAIYHGSYGLGGLIEELERIAVRGGHRLAQSWNAWPRVLALFHLVERGSHHPSLPVPAYGGALFAPADAAATDGLSRALSVFESARFQREHLSDHDVHRMLERITAPGSRCARVARAPGSNHPSPSTSRSAPSSPRRSRRSTLPRAPEQSWPDYTPQRRSTISRLNLTCAAWQSGMTPSTVRGSTLANGVFRRMALLRS